MNSPPDETLLSLVVPESTIKLSTEGLARGIDNYHIDVKLSAKFSSDIKRLVASLVPQMASPKHKPWDNSEQLKQFRTSYLDMMTVLIHRVKTDLTADHVSFLQLAVVKHILKYSRAQVDIEIKNTVARLADLKSRGASEALATDKKLFWLKRNYDAILYNVNRPFFQQIQRVEEAQLYSIRDQFLGEDYKAFVDLILNPLLWTSNLSNFTLQLNEYNLWDTNNETTGFLGIDATITGLLSRQLAPLKIAPMNDKKAKPLSTEIHDEMGGLFQLQSFSGPAEDTKERIEENFDWIEISKNSDTLFDEKLSATWLSSRRKDRSLLNWWKCRREVKSFNKFSKTLIKLLRKDKLLAQLIASKSLGKIMTPVMLELTDTKHICHFLAGKITLARLTDTITGSTKFSAEQIKSLEQYRDNVAEQVKVADTRTALAILHAVGKYRRDLKLFRFAHRAFNRINILNNESDIRLSKSAGTLYQLSLHAEVEQKDAKVCHHAILKADVRGSTTVTDELLKKGLNPASYFSMRFFKPINKILETYGANKVFIEGDAIILGFLEHENAPEEWFSVARACGYAKDMLIITGANNRYSTQMGLPLLELGVGICYSDESPRYLYDEDHPIMISRAIGLADRMSGCSWNLRAAIKKSLFNVDVLKIVEGDASKGEKGQDYARYNVNGISIDNLAFEKLQTEIAFNQLELKFNGSDYTFYVGKYPDVKGQMKDLIIRAGQIGTWANNEIQPHRNTGESYYEVVVNRKVIPIILEAANDAKADPVS